MEEQNLTKPSALFAGRYRLEGVIGAGGMSTVYRAYDTALSRPVAIKVLRSHPDDSGLDDSGPGLREQNEIAVSASLNHHSLVTLFEAGSANHQGAQSSYLVMELVDGPTLAGRLKSGPVASTELMQWAIELSEALLVIHSNDIVHRDVKPANVLLAPSLLPGKQFSAKLADFGIASLLEGTRITLAGTIVGTAAYLSPEQALGQPVGAASDIYSLGLVLLEALTGSPAFAGTQQETITARLHRDPLIPADIDAVWMSLLTTMTQRNPNDRPSALDLLNELSGAQSPRETLAENGGNFSPTLVMPAPTERLEPATTVRMVLPAAQLPLAAAQVPAATQLPPAARRRMPRPLIVGAATLVAAFVATVLFFSTQSPAPAPTSSPSTNPTSITPAASTPPAPSQTPQSSVTPVPAPQPNPGKGDDKGKGKGKDG